MSRPLNKTRILGKLRSEIHGKPWSIDARAFSSLVEAVERRDLEAVRASLEYGDEEGEVFRIENGVAIIPITGVLCDENNFMVRWGYASSYQVIEQQFKDALNNSQVKAILFYANSPGGSAIGCKRVADQIAKARGKKPVKTFVQGMCGSACFYIAAATDSIVATADSLVASVGTIYPHLEYSGNLKEFGVNATVFTNADSPKKGHGNIYEPLSDDAKATLQRYVDSYGRPFIEDVALYRGITPEDVIAKYGQGDAIRADIAVTQGVIDAIVSSFYECLASMASPSRQASPSAKSAKEKEEMKFSKQLKAQMFAMGLIQSANAADSICKKVLAGWCRKNGVKMVSSSARMLAALQRSLRAEDDKPEDEDPEDEPTDEEGDDSDPDPESDNPDEEDDVDEPGAEGEEDDPENEDDEDEKPSSRNRGRGKAPINSIRQRHLQDQGEARLADLRAAATLANDAAGYTVVTGEMVLAAHDKKLNAQAAMKSWSKKIAADESPVTGNRIRLRGEGADQFAKDIVDAMVYRTNAIPGAPLSNGASGLVHLPLFAVAAKCLEMAGQQVDQYGDKQLIAERAMSMGQFGARQTFYSANEGRQYVQASGSPAMRPGDFPSIMSALSNKFLDSVELDDDYSYEEISAVLPGGLSDFKPGLLINRGALEELDELDDAGRIEDLGMAEEVLSYIFLRRFANKWGWTPVMIANDDLGAFVEGMIGLEEAWQVTQNRLVLDRFTANETLLDGNALFADRANTGVGANPAANKNMIDSAGGAPSDSQWGLMEAAYSDIGGVATGRRVRGTLNVCLVPTGAAYQEARRTFDTLGIAGLEQKVAETTGNVGLYRGMVKIVPESELRSVSAKIWYGLRTPTKLNTATVVRGYFNGFGTGGRREQWYDPTNKTTYVSLEGRIAVAVKNWRYAVRNKGEN